jgi:ribonucleoside-diphosphate reductase alpha chain
MKFTEGKTWKIRTSCGSLFVTVNTKDKKPVSVFIQLGKAGGCSASQMQATAELITLAIESGTDFKKIVSKLIGIRCHLPTQEEVLSCSDAIAKVLKNYLIP